MSHNKRIIRCDENPTRNLNYNISYPSKISFRKSARARIVKFAYYRASVAGHKNSSPYTRRSVAWKFSTTKISRKISRIRVERVLARLRAVEDESQVESSQTRDLTMPRRRASLDNGNGARLLPRKERTLSGKQHGREREKESYR